MTELYNNIPCIYFAAADTGILKECNKAFCDYLGYTMQEVEGMKLEQFFTFSTRLFQQTHLYPLLELKTHAEEIYITLNSKDGSELPVLINAERKQTAEQILYMFAGIGVNKRKKFEDEIIAAKKAAEKALTENTTLKAAREELRNHAEQLDTQITLVNNQNKELKQFNHLATHTLQEPIRKLLFYSNQVLESTDPKTIATEVIKIKKAADDVAAKLKGLQQYVWLNNDELSFAPVNLNILLLHIFKEIERANPAINLTLVAEPIPMVEANMPQMELLLKEILLNAVNFRKANTDVEINVSASTLLLNNFRELTGKYKYDEFLKLEISDNGSGFDGKYHEQAFELFRKLHPTGGLGIGLALCKKIAGNHHGYINLESKKDIGTKLIIFLPLQRKN